MVIDLRPAEIPWSLHVIQNAMIFCRCQEKGHIESQKLRQKRTAEQGMEAAAGQGRHRWAGKFVAAICSEQPSGNNSRNTKPDFSTHRWPKIACWSSGGQRKVVGSQTKLIVCLSVIPCHWPFWTFSCRECRGRHCLMELLRIDPSVKVFIASGYSPEDELHREISRLVKGFLHKPLAILNY